MSAVDPPVDPPGAPPRNTPATTVSARFHTLSAYVARVSRATMPAGSARPNGSNGPNGHPRARSGSGRFVRISPFPSFGDAFFPPATRNESLETRASTSSRAWNSCAAIRAASRKRNVASARGSPRRRSRRARASRRQPRRLAPIADHTLAIVIQSMTQHAARPSERARRAAHRRLAPLPRDERQRVPDRAPPLPRPAAAVSARAGPPAAGSRRAAHRRGFLARDRHRDVVEHTPPRLRREPPRSSSPPTRATRTPARRRRAGQRTPRAPLRRLVRRDDAHQEHVEHQERAQVPVARVAERAARPEIRRCVKNDSRFATFSAKARPSARTSRRRARRARLSDAAPSSAASARARRGSTRRSSRTSAQA